jgi:hypothetical protein
MRTLDLNEAAAFLRLHQHTLEARVRRNITNRTKERNHD